MILQPKVVLIVEDEPLIRLVASETLADAGFEVIEAEHAEAALTALHRAASTISVLFTDIRMPGSMDGVQLAHRVHHTWPFIGLLVTSGNARPLLTPLPHPARFMAKPYDCNDIVAHVTALAAPRRAAFVSG